MACRSARSWIRLLPKVNLQTNRVSFETGGAKVQQATYVGLTENQPKAALYSSERSECSVAVSSLVPCKRQKPKAMKRRRSSRESGCVLNSRVSVNPALA